MAPSASEDKNQLTYDRAESADMELVAKAIIKWFDGEDGPFATNPIIGAMRSCEGKPWTSHGRLIYVKAEAVPPRLQPWLIEDATFDGKDGDVVAKTQMLFNAQSFPQLQANEKVAVIYDCLRGIVDGAPDIQVASKTVEIFGDDHPHVRAMRAAMSQQTLKLEQPAPDADEQEDDSE